MGRLTISCDDGNSWIDNHSIDDSVRCFEGGLDCDHSPYGSTGLIYANGWFVAAWGWGYPGTLDRSKDGHTWERVMDNTPTFANLTFGEGKFLANSNPLRVSSDAAQWSTGGDPGLQINQRSIDFIDYDGGRFIMTAESGTVRNILHSKDGNSWTPATARPELCGSYYTGLAFANGTAVISAGQGHVCYSKDGGVSWTLVQVDEQITSPVRWAGSEFRVYSGGTLHASPDGVTWSTEALQPANLSIGPLAITSQGTSVAANGGWQVWYEKQRFYRSSDGRNWEVLGPGKFVGSHLIRFITPGYVEPGAGCGVPP
jgi:photosystem II stability/assembly factor-like uncharacterized protein